MLKSEIVRRAAGPEEHSSGDKKMHGATLPDNYLDDEIAKIEHEEN